MKICSEHPEYQVPLISTFAFNGAEYWCPYCGYTGGMFGSGEDVKDTEKLHGRWYIYHEYSKLFLEAKGMWVCSARDFGGERIDRALIPDSVWEIIRPLAKSWKYNIKANKLMKTDEPDDFPEFECQNCARASFHTDFTGDDACEQWREKGNHGFCVKWLSWEKLKVNAMRDKGTK